MLVRIIDQFPRINLHCHLFIALSSVEYDASSSVPVVPVDDAGSESLSRKIASDSLRKVICHHGDYRSSLPPCRTRAKLFSPTYQYRLIYDFIAFRTIVGRTRRNANDEHQSKKSGEAR